MSKINSFYSSISYSIIKLNYTVNKFATNPSITKKVLQIANKIFAVVDFYKKGKVQDRKVTEAMKGSIEIIDFYGTFKDIIFWINPFSKDSLDQAALLESLQDTLCQSIKDQNGCEEQKRIAKEIFNETMGQVSFYSQNEVRNALRLSLEKKGYKTLRAEQIAQKLLVKQKSRPITLLFSAACFTLVDITGSCLTLKKWGLIDLSHISLKIGRQSKIFMLVKKIGVDTALGTIASAALVVTFGEASYRAFLQANKHYQSTTPEDKERAYKEFCTSLIDMASSGVDLFCTAAPLIFSFHPPVLITLAIVAKSTSLICVLIK